VLIIWGGISIDIVRALLLVALDVGVQLVGQRSPSASLNSSGS
jgi:hypothetical protein